MAGVGQPSVIALFWRRNRVSIIFPFLSLSAIFADYSNTQRYKAQQALLAHKSEDLRE